MKTLIRFDFPFHLLILIGSLCCFLFDEVYGLTGIYLVSSGWQVLMALLHVAFAFRKQSGSRMAYEVTVLLIAALVTYTLLIGRGDTMFLFTLVAYMALVPLMAIWSLFLSYDEGKKVNKQHTVWDLV